jgi:hypothetical protein
MLKYEVLTNTLRNKSEGSNTSRTNGTFGFALPTSRPFGKCEAFTNTYKINYTMSKTKRAVFMPSHQDRKAT